MKDEGGRILLVDDDERNRRLLRDLLQSNGYAVTEAADGEEALEKAALGATDVVLLDILMPKLDGFEVCRRIREQPDLAQVPVLMVTALAAREDRLKAIAAGANDFITKPIDAVEVMLRVRNAARMKRQFDELQARYRELQSMKELRDSLTEMIAHDNKALEAVIQWMRLLGANPPAPGSSPASGSAAQ